MPGLLSMNLVAVDVSPLKLKEVRADSRPPSAVLLRRTGRLLQGRAGSQSQCMRMSERSHGLFGEENRLDPLAQSYLLTRPLSPLLPEEARRAVQLTRGRATARPAQRCGYFSCADLTGAGATRATGVAVGIAA